MVNTSTKYELMGLIQKLFFLRLLPAVLVVVGGAGTPLLAQQGPTSASCTAYMSEKVVARYNCLVGTGQGGQVNFIQWEDGTASTGLGGWVKAGKDCFAASEQRSWKICRD
jgi:hypothetical protein